jgi:hypothetical protein
MKDNIVLFDIDGCLCEGECWTVEECLNAKPIEENIKKYNDIYLTAKFTIIYTARKDELIPATLEWLRRNNIRWHAFSNLKSPASLYFDDKAINIKDL